jgi:hypothetical protein
MIKPLIIAGIIISLLVGYTDLGNASLTTSQVYTDSVWGFKFPHPSDWVIKNLPGGQGVFLIRGDANINIMLFLGGTKPNQLLDSLIEQTKTQWQNYKSVQRTDRKYNQQTLPVQEFTGIAPNGMNAHAQMTVFSSGGFVYVFFMSAPDDIFLSIQPVWDELLKGFKPIKNGKLFAYDKGFFFWYPEDWNVAKQEGFIQFTPTNVGMQDDVPTELYFMFVEDISKENFSNPNDPRIAKYLDNQIKSVVPTLERTGEPLPIGNSVMFKWETTSPEGKIIQAYTFTKIAEKNLIALMAIGLKDLLSSRDADLHKIFASMDLSLSLSSSSGTSVLMQNFAGTWINYTANTETKIVLYPNGTANQNQGQGSWTVFGDRKQGKIIIKLQNGKENILEYKVHEEKGQTDWNKYWFNGQLYGKDIK